ncbi:MAG: cyclic nucleotide-binding domain-containing protein [Rhodospirillaceae bacterium]
MIDSDDLYLLLRESEFFKDCDEATLELVLPCVSLRSYDAGSYIIQDGRPADAFYLLRHGTVAIELAAPPHGRLVLQTLTEGDMLGWSWLVPPFRWSFDARAVSLVRALSLDAKHLRKLCDIKHDFGFSLQQRMIRVMAARLTAARLQMLDLYAPTPVSNF